MSNIIVRGTTPNIECKFKGDVTYNHFLFTIGSDMDTPWFSIRWHEMGVEYDKRTDVTSLKFRLSQRETLACKPGNAIAQIRAVDKNGFATVSNFVNVVVSDILKDGVISYE